MHCSALLCSALLLAGLFASKVGTAPAAAAAAAKGDSTKETSEDEFFLLFCHRVLLHIPPAAAAAAFHPRTESCFCCFTRRSLSLPLSSLSRLSLAVFRVSIDWRRLKWEWGVGGGGGGRVEEETRKEGRKRVGNYCKAKEGSERCAQQMQLSGQRRRLCVSVCVCVRQVQCCCCCCVLVSSNEITKRKEPQNKALKCELGPSVPSILDCEIGLVWC